MKHLLVLVLCLSAFLNSRGVTLAWGFSGHHDINLVAMRTLPSDVPQFLQTSHAVAAVEALGPEEDRLKGAGLSWDRDNDPAHYVDIDDNGLIAGAISLNNLPDDMETYAAALAHVGSDPYRTGYLPYAIVDGWEQLRKDFAYWRAFDYLARHAPQSRERATFAAERDLREELVIRDIGVWGHFVGDGSQPLHVSVHYNGWGNYPNPKGYTHSHIHAPFEGAFVRDHVVPEGVARLVSQGGPRLPDHLLSQSEILAAVGSYLSTTESQVPQLYEIERAGGFRTSSDAAVAFTTARLAAGARELRDLVVLAWGDSLYGSVGYPEIPVEAILSGRLQPGASAFGGD